MSRLSSASVFVGTGSSSGVRKLSRRSAALRKVGLKPPMLPGHGDARWQARSRRPARSIGSSRPPPPACCFDQGGEALVQAIWFDMTRLRRFLPEATSMPRPRRRPHSISSLAALSHPPFGTLRCRWRSQPQHQKLPLSGEIGRHHHHRRQHVGYNNAERLE